MIIVAIVFENIRFQNVFCPHENEKPASSNSYGLKRRFRKASFSCRISVDGRPNRRNKAAFFQIPRNGVNGPVRWVRFCKFIETPSFKFAVFE